ncbi:Hypothetical predicted protein [Octopus vulgaris]|uniref:Uncharacterized protein n=1 Tax=Octopus vulgaris TaxID=6645 RepID=A0AA36BW59_OCTVU|nr:Hypothetical predicted protein [Octopus vulgaris]
MDRVRVIISGGGSCGGINRGDVYIIDGFIYSSGGGHGYGFSRGEWRGCHRHSISDVSGICEGGGSGGDLSSSADIMEGDIYGSSCGGHV